jgi:hypothetical protein
VEWRTGVMCRKIRKKSLPSRKRITRDESILTRKKKRTVPLTVQPR